MTNPVPMCDRILAGLVIVTSTSIEQICQQATEFIIELRGELLLRQVPLRFCARRLIAVVSPTRLPSLFIV
jgi:hypothetical protein